jgi:hypothetical protein
MKSRKITISGPILWLCQNDALKKNSPHGPAVRRLLAVEMHSHASRSSLSSVFSEQIPKITTHKILVWYSQIPNRLIPNPLI